MSKEEARKKADEITEQLLQPVDVIGLYTDISNKASMPSPEAFAIIKAGPKVWARELKRRFPFGR